MTAPRYIAALDQGTTSTRCALVDHAGQIVALARREHRQIFPRPGWVEHDPLEIWQNTQEVIRQALLQAQATAGNIAAIGITNQRETTVLWLRSTGQPIAPAIVWQDTRTDALVRELAQSGGPDRFRSQTGLPLATYFSGPKIRWLLDALPQYRHAAEQGELLFGTMDTWLIWQLSGGPKHGCHVTDVTNASRTLLFNLHTLEWDDEILRVLDVPRAMLPQVRSSSEVYAQATGELAGVPIAGDLGDQQAALVGQTAFGPGEAKNTYGTGCFVLLNTGTQPLMSRQGLLTTVAYRFGHNPPVYALEGSIAIAGALVQWLRDNLGLIGTSAEIEALARSVQDNGGVYFVPAFSGLFAPYWDASARGLIIGLTRYANKGHLARAVLEATAFQTADVLEAMSADAGMDLQCLKVDGGMVQNELLMQFQADILGVPIIRPRVTETTVLGAAFAAGLAVGFWRDEAELRQLWQADKQWYPQLAHAQREELRHWWKKAVQRTRHWLSD